MPRVPKHRGPFGPDEARRLLWRAGFGPPPGGGRAAGRARPRPRGRLAGAAEDDAPDRPGAARRAGPPAGAARRLGPRPLLVARPHGAHRGAADRAHDARLARLVRHQQGGRAAADPDAAPERAAAPPRARLVREAGAGRHERPGDAAVAQRHLQQPLGRQRELRARAAGAVLPRRRPRLLRARRARDGAGADRVPQRLVRGPRPALASATTAEFHDSGRKRIYGRRGRYDWRDAVRLAVRNRRHPSFLVRKLWGYFIPTPPPRDTARALERMYVGSGRRVRPLLAAILRHPHLYDPGRRMAKPPVVQAAGMLRAVGRGVDTTAWAWMCDQAGQMLFEPPNVSGWDDAHWLDTATFRARWQMAGRDLQPGAARRAGDARQGPGRSRRAGPPRRRVLGQHAAVGGHPRGARALRRRLRWRPPRSAGSATPIPS